MIDTFGNTCCDTCRKPLAVGEYPFCPHGFGGTAIERDEIPGGVTLENYGPNPITFYSHSERRKYMEKHGLKEKESFSPMPGTDKDPQGIPNPAGYMDAQTLANAAELLCRNGKGQEFDGVKSGVLRMSSGDLTNEEAIRVQRAI